MNAQSPLRVLGTVLVVTAVANYCLVGANNHTRLAGGHDLRPLLFPATLMLVGGLGLISHQGWAKVISSILVATAGVWVIVHSLLVLPIAHSLFSLSIGVALFVPLFLTIRHRMRAES
jgi:hypothetical protein